MKKEFNILAMLISGLKSPGKCLNVFMQRLIDELNMLWDTGVLTFDRHDSSSFIMRAAVMWTISDFPGLGMLGGLKSKGYKVCPMCLDEVDSHHLAGRMSYQGHRRWLDLDHSWRHAATCIQIFKSEGVKEKLCGLIAYFPCLFDRTCTLCSGAPYIISAMVSEIMLQRVDADYNRRHIEKFERECPNRTKKERVKHFVKYFRDWMDIVRREAHPSYSEELHFLAHMPQSYACYSHCDVNGVKFVVWDWNQNKRTQNSGVMVEDSDLTNYGIIQNIIELRYANGMPVVIFDCTWFNTDPNERGSTKRDYGLLSVDISSTWFEDWPYCLANTARQVFYLDDLKAGEQWKVVNVVLHRGTYSDNSIAREDQNERQAIFLSAQDDDPYQEQIPTNITSDVQPYNYSMDDNGEDIPRARRQLNFDEEVDLFETGDDDSGGDEDDEIMLDDEDDVYGDDDEMDQSEDYVSQETDDEA
ncbi:hypothetical protein QQ045_022459 [Rhodiola kirilowii]